MSKLALGTVQFGLDYGVANQSGQVVDVEAANILDLARNKNITTLDTAIAYGESEKRLGQLGIEGFNVVTKLPPLPADLTDVKAWVDEQLQSSLKRLGAGRVKGLLLHRSEDLLGSSGNNLIEALLEIKKQGLVQQLGVSVYEPDELERSMQAMDIDLIQAPLNIIDRRLETSGWLSRLHHEGVEVHIRSAFLQGLLLMKRADIPPKFERWSMLWDQWHSKLEETGCAAYAAALSYPLSLPEVDRIVVGVDSVVQLQMLVDPMPCDLEAGDWDFMSSGDVELINPAKWSSL